jgi:hypothetical protein
MKPTRPTEFADAPIALQKMIADLRADLAAAEHTAALWGKARRAKKAGATNGHGHTITHALALDAARRARVARVAKPNTHRGSTPATRRRAARLLGKFDATTPRPWTFGRGLIGTLTLHGYLVKKGDGYVRTDKAFKV